MQITVICWQSMIVIRLHLIGFLLLLLHVTAAQSQDVTDRCQECRNQCVNQRVLCKSSACRNAGGTPNTPQQCDNVKDHDKYIKGLQECEKAEDRCWDQCARNACFASKGIKSAPKRSLTLVAADRTRINITENMATLPENIDAKAIRVLVNGGPVSLCEKQNFGNACITIRNERIACDLENCFAGAGDWRNRVRSVKFQ